MQITCHACIKISLLFFFEGNRYSKPVLLFANFFFRVKRGWALDFLARERGGWRYKSKTRTKEAFLKMFQAHLIKGSLWKKTLIILKIQKVQAIPQKRPAYNIPTTFQINVCLKKKEKKNGKQAKNIFFFFAANS